jgi:hypothetical protein
MVANIYKQKSADLSKHKLNRKLIPLTAKLIFVCSKYPKQNADEVF